MLKTLSLVLPVLIPSWRFFKTVEPSPRVQWTLLSSAKGAPTDWREFRPPPLTVTATQMLWRLFWNPQRNEDLFVISCAERIREQPTQHSIDEITKRIRCDIAQAGGGSEGAWLQFRVIFVHREGSRLLQEIVFISEPVPAMGSQPC